jgi:hypothetical protein
MTFAYGRIALTLAAALGVASYGASAWGASGSDASNRSTGAGFGEAIGSSMRSVTEKTEAEKGKEAPVTIRMDYQGWGSGSFTRSAYKDNLEKLNQDMWIGTLAGGALINDRFILGGGYGHGWADTVVKQKNATKSDNDTSANVGALYAGLVITPNFFIDVMAMKLWLETDEVVNGLGQSNVKANKDMSGESFNVGLTYARPFGAWDFGSKADFHWMHLATDRYTTSIGAISEKHGTIQRKGTLAFDAGYQVGAFHPSAKVAYEHIFNPLRDGVTKKKTDADGVVFGLGVDYELKNLTFSVETSRLFFNDNLDNFEAIASLKARF